MNNEFNNLVKENFTKLKSMCNQQYEAFIVALLCLEKGNNIERANQISDKTIELFREVYDEYASNDDYYLLNDNFEDTISEVKELIRKDNKNKQQER